MLFSYSIYPFVIMDDPENPPETKKIYYEKIEIYLSNELEYNEKHELIGCNNEVLIQTVTLSNTTKE